MKNDEYSKIRATKPKHVIYWARRDVLGFWIGRTVSSKVGYKNLQSPWLIGTIVEVGPAGWVTVLWEDGSINSKWNRKELDDYQGDPNIDHREILLENPNAYDVILKSLQSFDRFKLRRNGFPIGFKIPDAASVSAYV